MDKKKTVIYIRSDIPNNKIGKLKNLIKDNNWIFIDVYKDTSKSNTGFTKLLIDVDQNKFDHILFWSLDNFTTLNLSSTLTLLINLLDKGIDFMSVTEPLIHSINMDRKILSEFFLSLLKQDRYLNKSTKKTGRPPLPIERIKDIAQLRSRGSSIQLIASQLKLSQGVVGNYVRSLKL